MGPSPSSVGIPIAPAKLPSEPPLETTAWIGAAILDEIYSILSAQYVNKDELDEDTFRQAAISGVIASLRVV